MATVTFDPLKFVETLEAAELTRAQATAIASAVRDAQESADVATKGDIALVRKDVEGVRGEIKGVHNELSIHRWMLGFVFAGMISLLVKTFF